MTPDPAPERLGAHERLGLYVICAPGLAYLVLWLSLAALRCAYPSELEWMEGGMVAHAVRLEQGQPIYAPPSLDFVPFFYTPGYPALMWLLAPLFGGLSLTVGRVISISATLALLALIYHSVQRELSLASRGGPALSPLSRRLYALLGVGIYMGLYRTTGAFYDIARPDSLAALLTALVIYLGRSSEGARSALIAAALMSLAFFTKQTASVFYLAVGLYWLTRSLRDGLIYLLGTLSLCAAGCYVLNQQSDGAFWSYIFEGHQGHIFYWKNILLRYWRDLIFLAPITLAIPLLWFRRWSPYLLPSTLLLGWWLAALIQRVISLDYRPHMYYRELWYEELLPERLAILIPPLLITVACAFMLHRREGEEGARSLSMSPYWLWIFIAGAGASALNHSTQWAYANCFMPLGLACSLSIPLMLSDLYGGDARRPRLALIAIFITQWVAWLYSPSAQTPQREDWRAAQQLSAHLKELSEGGALLSPASPLLPWQLGLGSISTHQMGIKDVAYRGGVRGARERFQSGASKPPRRPEWSLVMTHEQSPLPWLEDGYYLAERLDFESHSTLRAKTGFLTRPRELWRPRYQSQARWLPGPKPLSADFEHAEPWAALGWVAEGRSFGPRPKRLTERGRAGDYAAQSSRPGLGSLSGQLARPSASLGPLKQLSLSLLVKVDAPRTQRHLALSISLRDARGEPLAQLKLRNARAAQRLRLSSAKLSEARWPIKLSIEDQDARAALWVDDLRWQRRLGSP